MHPFDCGQCVKELEQAFRMFSLPKPVGQTWIEREGIRFGAQPDERGPIGGGAGYRGLVSRGDYCVRTVDQLLDALGKAKAGEIIFIEGTAELDFTTRVHIESLVIEVPAGVTLAGDRGRNGSRGALLRSDAFATAPLIRAGGEHVRITGIRLRGPNPKRDLEHHRRAFEEGRGRDYYYRFPISDGIRTAHSNLEVDNCELAGWSHAAIFLQKGRGHHLHHNYIHHNQYQGLGYGICHDGAESRVERNLFDFNRHSIAGTGCPGTSYEAGHNVELGDSLSHCFDMHGGRDRKDGTDIAGTMIHIHHNTFRAPQTPIVIRGTPEQFCEVEYNWFPNHRRDGKGENGPAVIGERRLIVQDNQFALLPSDDVGQA